MAWVVKAETHAGKEVTLGSGFRSKFSAESHRIILKHWRRVWVEQTHSVGKITLTPREVIRRD